MAENYQDYNLRDYDKDELMEELIARCSVEDKLKWEHLLAVWDKYPSWEMEKLLPKK